MLFMQCTAIIADGGIPMATPVDPQEKCDVYADALVSTNIPVLPQDGQTIKKV